ncbi:MAG TPA: site-specific recombinase [Gammaproteobacteria bacterium]|nr:site-specific recombinase [Gammaproteobacteria bacterium]
MMSQSDPGALQATRLEELMRHLDAGELDAVDTLASIIAWLRPPRDGKTAPVIERIEQLVLALEADESLREVLAQRIQRWFGEARHLRVYTVLGLFSRRGLFSEVGQLLYNRINPAPRSRDELSDVLGMLFDQPGDARWVAAVPDDGWLRLLGALGGFGPPDGAAMRRARGEMLYALEMLSVWVAAEELEPELFRLDPRVAELDSAFVAQQREMTEFIRAYHEWLLEPDGEYHDDKHLWVLLEQCTEQVEHFRSRAVKLGTSVSQTFLLERLEQTLERIGALLRILDRSAAEEGRILAVQLFKTLVAADARRQSLAWLWRENVWLLSRSITHHSSDTGEHYITSNRPEYFRMFRSGAGAGLIIALLAFIKIWITGLGLASGAETLLVSLNYGFGFVLIHLLHFTIATKQPAMTAATLAEEIEQAGTGMADLRKLAELMIKVGRSQFIAVVGNVVIALPIAVGIGWLVTWFTGATVLDPAGVEYKLEGLRPLAGPALFYAAIAAVWLFVAGLVAGFFDNRSAYLDLSGRLRTHPLLCRLLRQRWRHRLADYLGGHYGALAGNFIFGLLLGSTAWLGGLFGLALDIRHVAFSSADLGFVLASQPPAPVAAMQYFGFVLLIGVVNLWVSFGLAMYVALRARETRIGSVTGLMRAYLVQLKENPAAFLLPPAEPPGDQADTGRP